MEELENINSIINEIKDIIKDSKRTIVAQVNTTMVVEFIEIPEEKPMLESDLEKVLII